MPLPSPPHGSVPSLPATHDTSPPASTTTELLPSYPSPIPAPPPRKARIALTSIHTPDGFNGRFELNADRLSQLATSIQAEGLLHPITLRPDDTGFTLIAGRHRLEACHRLGHTAIDATIIDTDDLHAASIRLTENVTRTQLTPVEEACQLNDLVQQHPAGLDGVAALTGRRPSWIQDRLEILEWPAELQQHVHGKRISVAAAKRLARIHPPERRDQYINHAALHGINAKTAALWQQDSTINPSENAVASQNAVEIQPAPATTETTIQCVTCAVTTRLENTRPIRICEDCLEAILTIKHKPPPPDTEPPPVHSPPLTPPQQDRPSP